MQPHDPPAGRDLVLVGGGHAHVAVLKRLAMRPEPALRLTLISNTSSAPYSGMIPGCIAGHVTIAQAHIELRPLCRWAGARFFEDAVVGLDLAGRRVLCADHPPVGFDLVSINTGSTPSGQDIPGASAWAVPVKPMGAFLAALDRMSAEVRVRRGGRFRVVVVGGGAGGVEVLLAVRERWRREAARGGAGTEPCFALVAASPTILPGHNRGVQRRYERILRERSVELHLGRRVTEVAADEVRCGEGERVAFDALIWATDAAAPAWLRTSGLATDAGGFVAVDDCLRSTSHPFVFAAGDVASVAAHPRPKSGVFAVRQGGPLADNLRRAARGEPLRPFAPQRQFLSLISTGDAYAVASRGPFSLEGRWVWRWKQWIDRRWMRGYQELPAMGAGGGEAMRCGGCGAKVGPELLGRVLRRLQPVARPDVLVGLRTPDDAAVLRVGPGQVAVQTVDFFRSFINDPFLFGQIAANHCLGDIFAMGAEPQSALAIVTVPHAAEAAVEEELYQVLAGAVRVLGAHGTELAGGHTAEGTEWSFGLAVNGLGRPEALWRKGGMRPGDALILTKPVGTGTLLAADMRGQARGAWIRAALASMLRSSREAARVLREHGATACTDVTGFGLCGHLLEMLRASGTNAALRLGAIPVLEGAGITAGRGLLSSLQAANERLGRSLVADEALRGHAHFALLFDPQTAGGLLAAVPAPAAAACVVALHAAGYAGASVVGEALPGKDDTARIQLQP